MCELPLSIRHVSGEEHIADQLSIVNPSRFIRSLFRIMQARQRAAHCAA